MNSSVDISQEFQANSLQRRAIDLGEWMMHTSLERAHAQGHPGLRPAHARLFIHLDWNGSRMSEIARATDVSKNAVGQTVAELVKLGYVELLPDPQDGRAKIVSYTARGRAMMAVAARIGTQIDAEIAAVIGRDRLDQLRSILDDLGIDQRTPLGRLVPGEGLSEPGPRRPLPPE